MRTVAIAVALAAFVHAGLAPAAAADSERGRVSFNKCRACHQLGEAAKPSVGPPLNGVVGAKAALQAGYAYSQALKAADLTWDEATLDAYLANPRTMVPGTKMSFAGMRDATERADLIAWLKRHAADGKLLPEPDGEQPLPAP